jgi:hypothetical protein
MDPVRRSHDKTLENELTMDIMPVLLAIVGVILLCALISDIFATVFVPRGKGGPIARRIYSGAWSGWRWIGIHLPEQRRRGWLAYLGPLLVPITVLVWGAALIVGFALIYAPWVPDFSISPAESGPMADWALALYYSGYSAVTLGVGDVTPDGTFPRLLTVMEAGFGFAIITVTVSYLLSVYSARSQATILSLSVFRFIGRGDGEDPVSLLIDVADSGAEEEVTDWLGRIEVILAEFVELEGQYPLINYFHEPRDDRALPIAISDLLDLVTISRSMLSPERFPSLATGPTTKVIERIGLNYLQETSNIGTSGENTLGAERRERYDDARRRLEQAGVPLRNDEEAWPAYDALRCEWDMADERIREWLGYRSATDGSWKRGVLPRA